MSLLSRMLCSLRRQSLRGKGTLQSPLRPMMSFPDHNMSTSHDQEVKPPCTMSLSQRLCSWWRRPLLEYVRRAVERSEERLKKEQMETEYLRRSLKAAMGPFHAAARYFLLDVVHRKFMHDHQNEIGRLRREARLAGRSLHKSGAVAECCKRLMAEIEQQTQQDLALCDMAVVQQYLAEHHDEWKFLHVMRSLNEACPDDDLFKFRSYRTTLERLAEGINNLDHCDWGILDNKGIYKDSYFILFKRITGGKTVEDVLRESAAGTLDESYKYPTDRWEFLGLKY